MTIVKQVICNESGATAIEYALIASLIAMVIIGAVELIGPRLDVVFTDVASEV